jgi:hypothetical protein
MNKLRSRIISVSKHVLTDVILIGVVESVHDCWFCGPFVLVDRLPQFLQIVVCVVAEDVQDVDQKLVFSYVQLSANTVTLLRGAYHCYYRITGTKITLRCVFYLPTDAQLNCLKNDFKIYIEIDIKTAPKCFGVITIIRERLFDLAKVTFFKITN